MKFRYILALLGIAFFIPPATAKEHSYKPLKQYKNWDAYMIVQDGEQVYYAFSRPEKSEGNYKHRGDICLMITNRPKQKSFHVISWHAGYPLKKDKSIDVKIYKQNKVYKTYKLYPDPSNNEVAWASDEVERTIFNDLKLGQKVEIQATSQRGTDTTDTFSLAGLQGAIGEIDQFK